MASVPMPCLLLHLPGKSQPFEVQRPCDFCVPLGTERNASELLVIDGFISSRLTCYHVTVPDFSIWHKLIIHSGC